MKKTITIIFLLLTILTLLYLEESIKIILIPLLVVCFYLGHKEEVWFNPYNILIISLISYLLYDYRIAPFFLQELSISTELLIILCFTAIIFGFSFCRILNINNATSIKKTENFWIILLIGLIPTTASVILFGNILEMEGTEMLETREKYSIPLIGQLAYFLPASIIIACRNNNSRLICLSIFLSLLAAFMTITKTAILVCLIFVIIGFTKFNPDILQTKHIKILKKTSLFWFPVLLIYVFILNNSVRHDAGTSTSMDYIERSGTMLVDDYTDFGESMFLNYLYYCSPWGNLQYNIDHNSMVGYGKNTFAQFGKKFGIEVDTVEKIEPTFLNTHSFITDFFIDFGYLGAIIASFILGFLIYFFYRKFGISDDPLLLAHYALICYATTMLFFSNHFTNGYLLNYLITFGGYSALFRLIHIKK